MLNISVQNFSIFLKLKMKIKLNNISEALMDFKNGKVLIVVDDENRENEGDFVFPAQIINKEVVNFMIKNGRGLVCVPMTSKRCKKLLLFFTSL